MTNLLRRAARWILREEILRLQREVGDLKQNATQWRCWALVQERYRIEVHGERPETNDSFQKWFFKTYPTKDMLP